MNPSSIVPPREGVDNLVAAREALDRADVSSSHISHAIIKSHSAVESLFRHYLSKVEFIPMNVRTEAADFNKTHFPDLVRDMSAHARPSLRDWESDTLKLNQIRNEEAHGKARSAIQLKEAFAFLELAEKLYSQYSRLELRGENLNRIPRKTMNPFVEEPQKAKLLTKYPSDDNYRVVWVKGKKAKVPGKGTFRCPIREFDKVAFVCLHERTLPINLSSTLFFSADKLPVQVQVDLIAQVKTTDWALIAVATCFDESLGVLQTEVTSLVREFCAGRPSQSILGSEKELALEILKRMESATSSSTLQIKDASAHLRIPLLEEAAERDAATTISFEQDKKKEERETNLVELRNARTLVELVAQIEREGRKVKAECEARTATAKTEREIKEAGLANVSAYARLTDDSKTAVLHLYPEIYRELKLAEIANDPNQRDRALQQIMVLLKPLAEITKSAAPITGVFGANITESK